MQIESMTIHLGPAIQDYFHNRPVRGYESNPLLATDGEYSISQSTAVNRLAERLRFILATQWPSLHEDTWIAVLNAMNGTMTEYGIDQVAHLASIVGDDLGCDDEDDAPRAVRELAGLTAAERVAVIECVERFWGAPAGTQRGWREVLADVSGRPSWSVTADDPALDEPWSLAERSDDHLLLRHDHDPTIEARLRITDGGHGLVIENEGDLRPMRERIAGRYGDPSLVVFSAALRLLDATET